MILQRDSEYSKIHRGLGVGVGITSSDLEVEVPPTGLFCQLQADKPIHIHGARAPAQPSHSAGPIDTQVPGNGFQAFRHKVEQGKFLDRRAVRFEESADRGAFSGIHLDDRFDYIVVLLQKTALSRLILSARAGSVSYWHRWGVLAPRCGVVAYDERLGVGFEYKAVQVRQGL